MKDLKENIQKNNIKKLVLSVALGMFCYCINNAVEHNEEEKQEEITIDEVLMTMLEGQNNINEAKKAFKKQEPRIYSTIKNEEEKVKKGKLLEFITSQFTEEEQKLDGFNDCIKILEQYFHLEEKQEDYECTKENLTEIFWNVNGGGAKIKGIIQEIKAYFITIMKSEIQLGEAFKKYYEIKKEKQPEAQEDNILKEIINDCCEEENKDDLNTNFLNNLTKKFDGDTTEDEEINKILIPIKKRINMDGDIEEATFKSFIKKRINMTGDIKEATFISFLKQKIGIEEKKDSPKGGKKKKKKGECTCCEDC